MRFSLGDLSTLSRNVSGCGVNNRLFLLPGSRGSLQGGASLPMENYFQAEAFNLDKVLDEFEQNEGEPLASEARRVQLQGEESEELWSSSYVSYE